MQLSLSSLVAVVFVSSLGAQTVVPAKYAAVEANSSTAYPFGLTALSRVQYLYDAELVGIPVIAVKQIAIN